MLVAELGQDLLDGDAPGLADQVADHQDAAGAVGPLGVAVGGVAEAGAPDRGGGGRGTVSHPPTIPDGWSGRDGPGVVPPSGRQDRLKRNQERWASGSAR